MSDESPDARCLYNSDLECLAGTLRTLIASQQDIVDRHEDAETDMAARRRIDELRYSEKLVAAEVDRRIDMLVKNAARLAEREVTQ